MLALVIVSAAAVKAGVAPLVVGVGTCDCFNIVLFFNSGLILKSKFQDELPGGGEIQRFRSSTEALKNSQQYEY